MGDGQVLTATGWGLYSCVPQRGSLYLLMAFLTAQLPKVASQMTIASHLGTEWQQKGSRPCAQREHCFTWTGEIYSDILHARAVILK